MGTRPLAFALLLATCAAQAPAGYKTYENRLATVKFFYPIAYQEMPVPPTEQTIVARYILREKPAELRKVNDGLYKAVEQQICVFLFELPAVTTGTGAAKDGEQGGKPANVRQAMEAQSRVSSWDDFCKRFAKWKLTEDGKKPGQFALAFAGPWNNDETRPVGYLVRKQDGNSIYGVYGVTLTPCEKALQSHVQRMAGGLELAADEAGAAAEAAIDRLYASGKYHGVPFRKRARSELAKGWRAVDTENYLIVHHSKNEALINQIAREIEAMRALYLELFPAAAPSDSLSVVRVCRTKEEYLQYGGPPGTGGYWHPGNEELVFFDYSYTQKTLDSGERRAMGGRVLTDDDSLLVLYHEAFHQYIHYAIGEFSPHDWFNEGYGDYFSGAVVANNTNRVVRVDPSSWRIHLAKDMCEYGEGFVPLLQILEAERAVFYNPARIRFFYAGAWSFVYFLKHSKEAAAQPKWSKILTGYFDGVKQAYQDELGKLGASPDLQARQVAGFLARKAALKAVLDGVDVPELEQAWRKWVVEMKDPWPGERKKHK